MSYGIIVRYIITYQRMNEEEIPVGDERVYNYVLSSSDSW